MEMGKPALGENEKGKAARGRPPVDVHSDLARHTHRRARTHDSDDTKRFPRIFPAERSLRPPKL